MQMDEVTRITARNVFYELLIRTFDKLLNGSLEKQANSICIYLGFTLVMLTINEVRVFDNFKARRLLKSANLKH